MSWRCQADAVRPRSPSGRVVRGRRWATCMRPLRWIVLPFFFCLFFFSSGRIQLRMGDPCSTCASDRPVRPSLISPVEGWVNNSFTFLNDEEGTLMLILIPFFIPQQIRMLLLHMMKMKQKFLYQYNIVWGARLIRAVNLLPLQRCMWHCHAELYTHCDSPGR